jgi:transport inhibitor response 1
MFLNSLAVIWDFQVHDLIANHGLAVVASSCSNLQDLRVVCAFRYGYTDLRVPMTDLVDVYAQSLRLESVLHLCSEMTNEALITTARNCPNMTCFCFRIFEPIPNCISRLLFLGLLWSHARALGASARLLD